MRKVTCLGAVVLLAPFLAAQDIALESLSALKPKAKETVEVNLDTNMLQLAARFLSDKNADEAKVRDLVSGLKGIYVRVYSFDKPGQYTRAEVDKIRSLVGGAEWQKVVDVQSSRPDGDNTGVYLRSDGKQIRGIVVVAAEAKELTVVNIVGSIDPARLNELGGKFGVPQINFSNDGRKAQKKDE